MRDGLHVIRGSVPFNTSTFVAPGLPKRLLLNNMDFTKNFVVEKFELVIAGPGLISQDLYTNENFIVVLATKESGALYGVPQPGTIAGATARDNRQIAWAGWTTNGGVNVTRGPVLLEDRLVVDDLFINGWVVDAGTGAAEQLTQDIGYVITLRQVTTTLDEAIMMLLKERAQDALTH